jgi:hypothetical protein
MMALDVHPRVWSYATLLLFPRESFDYMNLQPIGMGVMEAWSTSALACLVNSNKVPQNSPDSIEEGSMMKHAGVIRDRQIFLDGTGR